MIVKCSAIDCDRPRRANGFCGMHNMRCKRYGTTDDPNPYKPCIIEGCTTTTKSKSGFCTVHYKQNWYLKSVGRDILLERTSQEYWINIKTGYVMVKHEGKLTYEHRVLAEKALGKPLPKGAVIHHTGEPHDNCGYFKLVICSSQEYHALLHKRMRELGYENNQDA